MKRDEIYALEKCLARLDSDYQLLQHGGFTKLDYRMGLLDGINHSIGIIQEMIKERKLNAE